MECEDQQEQLDLQVREVHKESGVYLDWMDQEGLKVHLLLQI